MKIPIPAVIIFTTFFLVACEEKIAAAPDKTSRNQIMIVERKGLTPSNQAFTDSSPQKPVVIQSAAQAKTYFSATDLVKLTASVDFSRQVVLLFAWKGSSRDKIEYTAPKSSPEPITFDYRRGKTKDLRPHARVYVLKKDVKWRTK